MAITIFADRTSQCPLPADTDREGRGLADSLPGVVKLGPLVVVTGPSGPACVATRAPSWPASVRLPPSVDLRFSAFAEADDLRRLSPPWRPSPPLITACRISWPPRWRTAMAA